MPLGVDIAVGNRLALMYRSRSANRGKPADMLLNRGTVPDNRYWRWVLSSISHCSLVLPLLDGIVAICRLGALAVDLIHGLLPDQVVVFQ
jgi:hypothetical protein